MSSNPTDQRPDPDALLEQIERDEAKAKRGKLRVYFGSSAGVGKTFAMLAAAKKLKSEGHDVVVGVVETHGRAETAELLHGLDILPRKRMGHHGNAYEDFDIDGALARRPELILVDEFAHSNAAGSRHPKRWQDVDELLGAGIDVFTTLNVQHLESLNDVVSGITGIRVNETVPDTIFDSADEVLLIDIPADELLKRMRAGKVYMPEQAERASRNFFRKGNLMALRELALRRTADRVEEDVQAYRDEKDISDVWKTDAALLACIGPSEGAEHVVRSAARLAGEFGGLWHAVYVETPSLQRMSRPERERILQGLKLAESLGAKTTVLSSQASDRATVALTITDYTAEHNFSRIVLGRSSDPFALWWPFGRTLSDHIATLDANVDIIAVAASARKGRPIRAREAGVQHIGAAPAIPWKKYGLSAGACIAATLLATPLLGLLDLANIVMFFLLTVVLVAWKLGRGPAVLASVLSVLLFDFFFVPPRLSFAVSDVQYLVTFGVMLAVGLVIGQLTANIRYGAMVASHREARARSLYEFARDLSAALQSEQVLGMATTVLEPAFRAQVTILLPDANGRLLAQGMDRFPDIDPSIAQWSFDRAEPAGWGTDTLPSAPFRYLPLKAPMRVRGVLAIRPDDARWLLVPEQNRQLETFCALIAIALERVHYVDVASNALLSMESERLRNSLLAAISHDLRTPLTALIGLAETMTTDHAGMAARHIETAESVRSEAVRLAQLVENLLDMARLQSGKVELRIEWQSVEETIGSALASIASVRRGRQISIRLAPDLPLVEFDAALMERVVVNLVENALKYTQAPIEITGDTEDGKLQLRVLDRGPGLPPGMEEAIFEKFSRGERESATSGVGLGLAICRAIVEAHHGSISAANRVGGGAVFTVTLPLGEPPSIEESV